MKARACLHTSRSSPKDVAPVYVQCLGLRPTRPLAPGGNVQFMQVWFAFATMLTPCPTTWSVLIGLI